MHLLKHLYKSYYGDNISIYAAGLSFFAVFSLAPLLTLFISVLALLINRSQIDEQIVTFFSGFAGNQGAAFAEAFLSNINQPEVATVAGSISLVLFLWGGSNWFLQLKKTLDKIYDVAFAAKGYAGYFMPRIKAVLNMFLLIVLFGLFFAINFLLTSYIESSSINIAFFESILSYGTSFVLSATLFFAIYLFIPEEKAKTSSAFLGSLFAAALFLLGREVINYLFVLPEAYSVYGVSSALVIVLFWIFYTTNIFLLGAEVVDYLRQKR